MMDEREREWRLVVRVEYCTSDIVGQAKTGGGWCWCIALRGVWDGLLGSRLGRPPISCTVHGVCRMNGWMNGFVVYTYWIITQTDYICYFLIVSILCCAWWCGDMMIVIRGCSLIMYTGSFSSLYLFTLPFICESERLKIENPFTYPITPYLLIY
jgi:hypothetical protein